MRDGLCPVQAPEHAPKYARLAKQPPARQTRGDAPAAVPISSFLLCLSAVLTTPSRSAVAAVVRGNLGCPPAAPHWPPPHPEYVVTSGAGWRRPGASPERGASSTPRRQQSTPRCARALLTDGYVVGAGEPAAPATAGRRWRVVATNHPPAVDGDRAPQWEVHGGGRPERGGVLEGYQEGYVSGELGVRRRQ